MGVDLARTGLVVVDVQCGSTTLCPDELPVPGGLEIVPAVNRLLAASWLRPAFDGGYQRTDASGMPCAAGWTLISPECARWPARGRRCR